MNLLQCCFATENKFTFTIQVIRFAVCIFILCFCMYVITYFRLKYDYDKPGVFLVTGVTFQQHSNWGWAITKMVIREHRRKRSGILEELLNGFWHVSQINMMNMWKIKSTSHDFLREMSYLQCRNCYRYKHEARKCRIPRNKRRFEEPSSRPRQMRSCSAGVSSLYQETHSNGATGQG